MPKYMIDIESRKVIENKLQINYKLKTQTSQLVMVKFILGPMAKTTLILGILCSILMYV
jgi:hypothetical protein